MPSSASRYSYTASTTTVQFLANLSPALRQRIVIYNDSTSANLYLAFGSAGSTTDYTYKLLPGGLYTEEQGDAASDGVWNGSIFGVWDSASGAARVTEVVR